jgi:hypothetical protein
MWHALDKKELKRKATAAAAKKGNEKFAVI